MDRKIDFMKNVATLLLLLIIPISAFSQTDVKVRILPSKIATETEILIPFGEHFIYERYSYFKKVYWLMKRDTLILENNILKGEKVLVNLDVFNQEYGFCDSKINKIRNSALNHKEWGVTEKISREKIGYDNKEIAEFKRNTSISREIIESTCSDSFLVVMSEWTQNVNEKIEEIYNQKIERKKWIENNRDKIDVLYIVEFLKTFDRNIPDIESFIEIIIVNPKDLITEINRQEFPYLIYWKLDITPKSDRLSKAIDVLENSKLGGKTYRKIKKQFKKSNK